MHYQEKNQAWFCQQVPTCNALSLDERLIKQNKKGKTSYFSVEIAVQNRYYTVLGALQNI